MTVSRRDLVAFTRLARWLVALYPPEFIRRYGAEMTADYIAGFLECQREGNTWAKIGFVLACVGDTAASVTALYGVRMAKQRRVFWRMLAASPGFTAWSLLMFLIVGVALASSATAGKPGIHGLQLLLISFAACYAAFWALLAVTLRFAAARGRWRPFALPSSREASLMLAISTRIVLALFAFGMAEMLADRRTLDAVANSITRPLVIAWLALYGVLGVLVAAFSAASPLLRLARVGGGR